MSFFISGVRSNLLTIGYWTLSFWSGCLQACVATSVRSFPALFRAGRCRDARPAVPIAKRCIARIDRNANAVQRLVVFKLIEQFSMTSESVDISIFLSQSHEASLKKLRFLGFDSGARNQLHVVSLYCAIIEYSGTMLTLVENQRRTGFSSVFRSYLEAYVDLYNLLEDEEYYFRKKANYHNEWLKVLRECRADNEYLRGIAESKDLVSITESHQENLTKLRASGHTPVNVFESFAMADMQEEYHSIYRFEAAESHNDFRALMKRNIIEKEDGSLGVEAYQAPKDTYFHSRLDTATALLIDSGIRVHTKFETKAVNDLKEIFDAFTQLREAD